VTVNLYKEAPQESRGVSRISPKRHESLTLRWHAEKEQERKKVAT
jgi:hypothetical protein